MQICCIKRTIYNDITNTLSLLYYIVIYIRNKMGEIQMKKKLSRCTLTIAILIFSLSFLNFNTFAFESMMVDNDSLYIREKASKAVQWKTMPLFRKNRVKAKILAINDFHGNIMQVKKIDGRAVGGASVLGSYLKTERDKMPESTIIAHVGDQVGASQPESALLQDEPAILFFNMLANDDCDYTFLENPLCNLLGTIGNHEFDEGEEELLRLIYGGNYPSGPFLENPYRGAIFPYISANILYENDKSTFINPYIIKDVAGVNIAFIGAVLKNTPSIVSASGVEGLTFIGEAEAINSYIPELKAKGIETIIVVIHEGGKQDKNGAVTGPIQDIVYNLDDEIDVVLTGHSHSYINTLIKNKNKIPILVTQAFSSGTAYADVELTIDKKSKDVISKSASIITAFADDGPGLTPDKAIENIVQSAKKMVEPIVNEHISNAKIEITKKQNAAGESALGNLISDAHRWAMKTDFAFMNPGGIRSNIEDGDITYGILYTIQPFGNVLIEMSLYGHQIYELLNQQWQDLSHIRMLQISGLKYIWDASKPYGEKIIQVFKDDGAEVDKTKIYTVAANQFLADGGDNFTILKNGTDRKAGPVDLDALISYLDTLVKPVFMDIEGRIEKINHE